MDIDDLVDALAAIVGEMIDSPSECEPRLFEPPQSLEPLPDCFGVDPTIHPGDPFREPRFL